MYGKQYEIISTKSGILTTNGLINRIRIPHLTKLGTGHPAGGLFMKQKDLQASTVRQIYTIPVIFLAFRPDYRYTENN